MAMRQVCPGYVPFRLSDERRPVARWWRDDPSEGSEPDYRFTLANERTVLAWVRTALGLLAAGVAVRQLVEPFGIAGGRTLLALLGIAASVVLVVGAYARWVRVQRAVRRSEPLPPARLVPVVAAAIAIIAVVAFFVVAFG
jgi:putative membrane protein